MYDQYNRKIDYLRISLTDRCNLHCKYCQPDVMQHVAHSEILRYEEIIRVCKAAVVLGITKFKITGGEPLLRKGCAEFICQLKQLEGVKQVTLTTNGTFLTQFLPALIDANVDCVNVSLDTMDAKAYHNLTGGVLKSVLQGLEALCAAKVPFKINCVPLAGIDIDNILNLLALADKYKAPLRFIELMPLACNGSLEGVSGSRLRCLLAQKGLAVTQDTNTYGNGPATYYRVPGYAMPIGFIEPLHNKFCAACNRVRLTSVGLLKPCLYSSDGLDVRSLLRSKASIKELQDAMQKTIFAKPAGHKFEEQPAGFNMSAIGG